MVEAPRLRLKGRVLASAHLGMRLLFLMTSFSWMLNVRRIYLVLSRSDNSVVETKKRSFLGH